MRRVKKEVVEELAEIAETPFEFVEYIAKLRKIPKKELFQKAGISGTHFHVAKHCGIIGTAVGLKLSRALDINPYILNRLIADYKLKKLLEKK